MRAIVFAIAALCMHGQAEARSLTETVGAGGGFGYAIECRAGDYLTGLKVRSGPDIIAIGIICSTWTNATMRELDTRDHFAGDSAGPRTAVRCQGAAAIEYMDVQTTASGAIGFVQPTCIRLAAPFGHSPLALLGVQDTRRQQRTLQCPPGELATGLHGRFDGPRVISLGLVCELRPQAGGNFRRSPATMSEPTVSGAPNVQEAAPPAPAATRPGAQQVIDALLATPCRFGYVPRKTKTSDAVCVTPQSRATVREENRTWLSRVDRDGPNGLASCIAGHVWRGAFEGDMVCVTPERAAAVAEENARAAERAAP